MDPEEIFSYKDIESIPEGDVKEYVDAMAAILIINLRSEVYHCPVCMREYSPMYRDIEYGGIAFKVCNACGLKFKNRYRHMHARTVLSRIRTKYKKPMKSFDS